jgi:hypothetical protein
MATRGWGTSLALAVGVAAGCAAAQLGIAYGTGVVVWPTQTDARGESAWLASLAWISWIAATCVVLGAVLADRLAAGEIGGAPPRRSPVDGLYQRLVPGSVTTGAWRLVLALAAAIGGLLTVPLVAIPARLARRPDNYAPQLVAGGYAIVGVVIGLLLAIVALTARAVAANLLATSGWIWALAVTAGVSRATAGTRDTSTAPLAIWHFGGGHFVRSTFSWPGAALMLSAAFLLGVVAAWPALRRGDNRIGIAISGAFGPLVIAAAYFLATPKLVGVQADEQLSAFLIAPYAVIAGLAGSVLLAALRAHREQRAAAAAAPAEVPAQRPATSDDGEQPSYDDDLAADGYAPASAYATSSAGGAGSTAGSSRPAPLWPDSDQATESQPAASATSTATEDSPSESTSKGSSRKSRRR